MGVDLANLQPHPWKNCVSFTSLLARKNSGVLEIAFELTFSSSSYRNFYVKNWLRKQFAVIDFT